MASQITTLMSVYSTVYSGADQRKHQSSASLAFVKGIHRWPVTSPHKGPVTRKLFSFDDVIMEWAVYRQCMARCLAPSPDSKDHSIDVDWMSIRRDSVGPMASLRLCKGLLLPRLQHEPSRGGSFRIKTSHFRHRFIIFIVIHIHNTLEYHKIFLNPHLCHSGINATFLRFVEVATSDYSGLV